jgi:hypothetical protein
MKPSAIRLYPWLAWIAFFLSLAAWHVSLVQTGWRDYFFNSDMLTIEALYRDVAAGVSLGEWRLSGAPSFFPDMPVYFTLRTFLADPAHAVLLFGLTYLALMIGGWCLLWRAMHAASWDRACGSVALAAAAGMLMANWRGLHEVSVYMLANTSHSGVLVMMPWCLWLFWMAAGMTGAKPAGRGMAGVALALLVAAGTASDNLFIPQVFVPLVVVAGWLLWMRAYRARVALPMLAGILGAGMAGLWLGRQLNLYPVLGHYVKWTLPWSDPAIVGCLTRWWVTLWKTLPAHAFVVFAYAMVASLVAVRALWSRFSDAGPRRTGVGDALALFYVAATGANLLLLVIAGHADPGSVTRYMMVTFVVPVFFGWPLLLQAIGSTGDGTIPPRRGRALCAVCVVVVAGQVPLLAHGHVLSRYATYYPPQVACLDEELARRGLTHGFADYWQAKRVTCLSRHGVRLVQVTKRMEPFFWVSNWAWYRAEPQFIVIDPAQGDAVTHRFEEEAIRAQFGEPQDVFDCPPLRILVYNRPTDVAFKGLFAELGPPRL